MLNPFVLRALMIRLWTHANTSAALLLAVFVLGGVLAPIGHHLEYGRADSAHAAHAGSALTDGMVPIDGAGHASLDAPSDAGHASADLCLLCVQHLFLWSSASLSAVVTLLAVPSYLPGPVGYAQATAPYRCIRGPPHTA